MNQAEPCLTLGSSVSPNKTKLYHFPQPHKLICKMGIGPNFWTAMWIKRHNV